jgi:DNA processing protein
MFTLPQFQLIMMDEDLDDPRRYWIGFNLVKGIGAVRLRELINYFGDVEKAWKGTPTAMQDAGLSPKMVERFVQLRAGVDLNHQWEQIIAKGIKVLTWDDEGYPLRLREIDQPPPVLYLRGNYLGEDQWSVAIVGTRRVTSYGRQITEEIASYLARNKVTIVSGLARGVDAIAHQAALKAGGRTLAVLGNGVDRVYPPEHRALADQIINSGALLSDYPPGTPPEGFNFPPRNRIIAGLSLAVIVIEAGETSGALITAEFAAEQGREVFAVPGNILAAQSKGTNRLIQQGAHSLLDVKDILDILNLTHANEHQTARKVLPVDIVEAQVLNTLGNEPLHIDEIRNQTGLPIEKVSAALVLMELKGMVRQVGGMHYVATREVNSEYLI